MAQAKRRQAEPSVDATASFRVEFKESSVSLEDLVLVLDSMDAAFRDVEDIVLQMAPHFDNFDTVIVDAARHRLRQSRRQSVRVSSLQRGSLIVEGTFVILVIGILKNTIGESLKQGWTQSELHGDIVEFTQKSLDRLLRETKAVPERIRRRLERLRFRVVVRQDESRGVIRIRISSRRDDAV